MGVFSSELPKGNLIRVTSVTSLPPSAVSSNKLTLSSMSTAQIAVRLAVGGPGTGALEPHESHTASGFIIEFLRASERPCFQERTDQALYSSRLGR